MSAGVPGAWTRAAGLPPAPATVTHRAARRAATTDRGAALARPATAEDSRAGPGRTTAPAMREARAPVATDPTGGVSRGRTAVARTPPVEKGVTPVRGGPGPIRTVVVAGLGRAVVPRGGVASRGLPTTVVPEHLVGAVA